MTLVKKTAESIKLVVVDAAKIPGELVRHELPDGIAISHLFDGDEQFPKTCQWRVVAQSENALRAAVDELIVALESRGVDTLTPRFSGQTCYVDDRGPW